MAVVVVRNSVDHDSRVLREARTLRALGMDVTVLGVVSFTQRREVTEHDGIPVRRIAPGSRLGWAVYREISRLRPRRPAPERSEAATAPPARARGLTRGLLRRLSTLAYYARATPRVVALRPDLVHCNDYNTMWVGLAARLLCGSALVYDSHELWPDRNLRPEWRPWLLACEALFVRVADRVVMTSPAHAEVLARRYRVPEPTVVRNIPERATESRPAPAVRDGRPEGERLAIYVGGLQPGRGIEQAIRALALVDGARLRLLGPAAPEYRAGLEALAGTLGLADRVEFAAPVAPEQVLDAVRGSDVGLALFQPVCLNHRLLLPNKLFEYALAGVPVVGSDLPMISRFIREHGLGVTVDPADVPAVAAGLRRVLDPGAHERFRAAAKRAAATLDWSRERELLVDVYRGALAARGRAGVAGHAGDRI